MLYLYGYVTNEEIFQLSKKIKQYPFDDALNLIDLLINKYPNNPECYMIKGDLYYKEGYELLDYTIENFSRVIELDDMSAMPYYSRGLAFVDQSLFYEAIEDFTMIIDNKSLEHRDYVLKSSYAFRVISNCALGNWNDTYNDIRLVDKNFITYNHSFNEIIDKERLVNCIEKKILLI